MIPQEKYRRELEVAVESAIYASKLCMSVQKDFLNRDTKSSGTANKNDTSPVTIADFGAQAIINMHILENFPSDRIVGEENASILRDNRTLGREVTNRVTSVIGNYSETEIFKAIDRGNFEGGRSQRFWAIDPIDGTKGFLRGEQYAIAIGLIEEGQVVFGLLACPNLKYSDTQTGYIAFAIRNHGAYSLPLMGDGSGMAKTNDIESASEIHVSQVEKPEEAWFVESVESAHSSHSEAALIAERLGIVKPPVRIDSQAKYAIVARGDAPLYMRIPSKKGYIENIWDHAAGSIIVEEAGGRVTDIFGRELDFELGRKLINNKGILASNGKLHSAAVESISVVLNQHE